MDDEPNNIRALLTISLILISIEVQYGLLASVFRTTFSRVVIVASRVRGGVGAV